MYNGFTLHVGYIGSKSFLEKVGDKIKELKKKKEGLIYGIFHSCHLIVLSDIKVSHMCTTNFRNYIPIFLQSLKELPW